MKIRAFVFDDDDRVRSVLTAILKERGYEVYEFSEPRLCPLLLDNTCPCPEGHVCADIVISDLNMPTMNGLAFIENQHRHGCKGEHFALLSGAYSDEELQKARSSDVRFLRSPSGWPHSPRGSTNARDISIRTESCGIGSNPNREGTEPTTSASEDECPRYGQLIS